MQATDSISCNPTSDEERRNAIQAIIAGRKSWKTMKGRGGEAVWPPELELALIEGLYKYFDSGGKSGKTPNRYPLRNKMVSDHILRTTGQYRKPKQVGSRVQQLRDTAGGRELLNLLSQRDCKVTDVKEASKTLKSPLPPGPQAETEIRALSIDALNHHNGASTSSQGQPALSSPHKIVPACRPALLPPLPVAPPRLPPRAFIDISIIPETHFETMFNFGQYGANSRIKNLPLSHFSCASPEDISVFSPPSEPTYLGSIDPIVTLASRFHLNAYSAFSVFVDDGQIPVHTEFTSLICTRNPSEEQGLLSYSTTLVPSYWHILRDSEDPTRYTIVQEIVRNSDVPTSNNPIRRDPTVMFSAVYKFNYAAMSDSSSSRPSTSASEFSSLGSFSPQSVYYQDFDFLDTPVESHPPRIHNPLASVPASFDHLSLFDQPLSMNTSGEPYVLLGSEGEFDTERTIHLDSASIPPLSTCFPSGLSNYV